MSQATTEQHVVIIGGGFSGTLLAIHLLKQDAAARIDIVEPRELGLGIAYSTVWVDHLLNVPAIRMSAFGREPTHFLEWLHASGMPGADAGTFIPRRLFGTYIQRTLEAAVRASRKPFCHHRTEAISAAFDGTQAEVLLANGERISGTRVVLACGNTTPRTVAQRLPNYARSPWESGALTSIRPDGSVLLIGSGLTAIDALLALRANGHRGKVHAVSRWGNIPHTHRPYHPITEAFRPHGSLGAALLLRTIRSHVEEEWKKGVDWRAVLDSLRPVTNDIWSEMEADQQRRVLRHLKRWWDIHRHRMAPEIGSKVEAARGEGSLQIHAGRLKGLHVHDGGLRAEIALRSGDPLQLDVQRVIQCAGSDDNYAECANPLIRSLLTGGWILPGVLGRGLRTNADGELIDAMGAASGWLFTLGPPRFGGLFETTAVPELRRQAEALANHLASLVFEPVEISPELFIAMGI